MAQLSASVDSMRSQLARSTQALESSQAEVKGLREELDAAKDASAASQAGKHQPEQEYKEKLWAVESKHAAKMLESQAQRRYLVERVHQLEKQLKDAQAIDSQLSQQAGDKVSTGTQCDPPAATAAAGQQQPEDHHQLAGPRASLTAAVEAAALAKRRQALADSRQASARKTKFRASRNPCLNMEASKLMSAIEAKSQTQADLVSQLDSTACQLRSLEQQLAEVKQPMAEQAAPTPKAAPSTQPQAKADAGCDTETDTNASQGRAAPEGPTTQQAGCALVPQAIRQALCGSKRKAATAIKSTANKKLCSMQKVRLLLHRNTSSQLPVHMWLL